QPRLRSSLEPELVGFIDLSLTGRLTPQNDYRPRRNPIMKRRERGLLTRGRYILWTEEARIYYPFPILSLAFLDHKIQGLVVSIDQAVESALTELGARRSPGQTAGIVREVWHAASAIPAHVVPPETTAREHAPGLAEGNHVLEKAKDVTVLGEEIPIEP